MRLDVNREVVRDLWPLYQSGDANPASKALVEEYLRLDPGFSTELGAADAGILPAATLPGLPPDREREAMLKTKSALRHRSAYLFQAGLFTALACAFTFDAQGVQFVMLRDAPVVGGTFLAVGMLFWSLWLLAGRKLRVRGL